MNIQTQIPLKWRYLKIDLFDNASTQDLAQNKSKLKIALSIQKHDEEDWSYFRAGLNSPFRHMKRGVDPETHDKTHYKIVEELYHNTVAELGKDCERINASKMYKKGYAETKRSVNGLSTILFRDAERWYVYLIVKHDVYLFPLSGANLSTKQRKNNIIASTKQQHKPKGYDMYNVDDLI